MTQKRILFVDDEPNVLQGLRRMLRSLRHEWEIETAESGEQALSLMSQSPFDVIVSDMRMPGMNGAQLLNEVMTRHPQVVRLVLSGQSDQESVFKAIGPTHQYLSKPCSAETLKATIDRACSLQSLLKNDTVRRVVSQVNTLPSLPTLYSEISRELASPEASLEKIGRIIARDPGMTAKLLQLVNSAFFGFYSQVSEPTRAVMVLGLDRIRSLVLSIHIFDNLSQGASEADKMGAYWRHNLLVGQCARSVAGQVGGTPEFQEEAYMAGLLHDTGKLILLSKLPQEFKQALACAAAEGRPVEECEKAVIGASHADIGAYLLGLWGLPAAIVEAVAFHHHPQDCPNQTLAPLTCVCAVDLYLRELQAFEPQAEEHPDMSYWTGLNLAEKLEGWRALCEKQFNAAVQNAA